MVAVDATFFGSWTDEPLPLTAAPVEDFQGLAPAVLVVDTDGSPAALDRARTALSASDVTTTAAASRADDAATDGAEMLQSLSVPAYLAAFVVVVIAGISLAVATAAAIIDRRRVLGLMRLIGMPLSALRGVVTREAAVPLTTVLLLSTGSGFFVAWLLVTGLDDTGTLNRPSPPSCCRVRASSLSYPARSSMPGALPVPRAGSTMRQKAASIASVSPAAPVAMPLLRTGGRRPPGRHRPQRPGAPSRLATVTVPHV